MRHFLVTAFILALTGCLALQGHDGPWACTSESDCHDPTQACKSTSSGRQCVSRDYCAVDFDCPAEASQCSDNVCVVPPCMGDYQCSPYACVESQCRTSCAGDSDCAASSVCTGGACRPRCAGDSACPSGALCNSGVCGPRACTPGSAGQCDGYGCLASGVCDSTCTTTCDHGFSCSEGVCSCDPAGCGGYACATPSSCLTSCTTNSDCAQGGTCVAGRCKSCQGTATPCAERTSCATAYGCYQSSTQCTGGTFDCGLLSGNSITCDDALGCSYDFNSGACGGTTSCAQQLGSQCPSEGGCALTTPCDGTPTACFGLDAVSCGADPGCTYK